MRSVRSQAMADGITENAPLVQGRRNKRKRTNQKDKRIIDDRAQCFTPVYWVIIVLSYLIGLTVLGISMWVHEYHDVEIYSNSASLATLGENNGYFVSSQFFWITEFSMAGCVLYWMWSFIKKNQQKTGRTHCNSHGPGKVSCWKSSLFLSALVVFCCITDCVSTALCGSLAYAISLSGDTDVYCVASAMSNTTSNVTCTNSAGAAILMVLNVPRTPATSLQFVEDILSVLITTLAVFSGVGLFINFFISMWGSITLCCFATIRHHPDPTESTAGQGDHDAEGGPQ